MRLFWLCCALVCAAACAAGIGTARPAPEALTATIAREIAAIDGVPWSDRPLAWSDFKGPVPSASGDRGAETAYSLFHAVRCTGGRFEFRVVTALVPSKSWVAPAVLRDPALNARTLRHEQTHFDISEVHARRLRRHFAQLIQPCARREQEDFDELAVPFLQDEAAAHRRYDQETSHGRLQDRQRSWDAETARQLLTLDQYRDPN